MGWASAVSLHTAGASEAHLQWQQSQAGQERALHCTQVDVVVGFSNGGEEPYNVTDIAGSLHSSAQWKLWVQNFTALVSIAACCTP